MTTEFSESAREVIERHIEFQWSVISLEQWLTEDIVKLIQLMDAELQRRYDEEQAIRAECQEAFQADLFNGPDEDESDAW